MKKLYLIATLVIILALAVPAIVSAADPAVVVPIGGYIERAPDIGLNVISVQGAPWAWDTGPGPYVREGPNAIAIDVHCDGWFNGYTFYVYDNENPAVKLTEPGYFAQHSHPIPPDTTPGEYLPGGKTLVNPLKVSSGLTEVVVSGSTKTLGSTATDGGPGVVDHYFINQTQVIDDLDRPLPQPYHYQIGLTFGMHAN